MIPLLRLGADRLARRPGTGTARGFLRDPATVLLLAGSVWWAVAVSGVPLRALPWLAVTTVAAAVLPGWWPRQGGWLRDALMLAGAVVTLMLVPTSLPLVVAVAAVVLCQPLAAAPMAVLAGAAGILLAQRDAPPPVSVITAATLLTVVIIAALGHEIWTEDAPPARPGRPRWRAWLGWVGVPTSLAVAIGLGAGIGSIERPVEDLPLRRPDHPARAGHAHPLQPVLTAGGAALPPEAGTVVARLDPAPPGDGTVYLRVMALSRCCVEGPAIRWTARDEAALPAAPPGPPPGPTAWLWRAGGGDDARWRVDGTRWLDGPQVRYDADGNALQPGAGRGPSTTLVVTAEAPPPPTDAESLAVARRYPADLSALPWDAVEDRSWGSLAGPAAGAAVAAALAARCTYARDDLPPPAPGPGGALRTFLGDADPAQRRGHCQYFASAAALLLRRAGHPARVVIGFASRERDGTGVIVRSWDAHAWVEVADPHGQWLRVDPTPPLRGNALRPRPPAPAPPPAPTALPMPTAPAMPTAIPAPSHDPAATPAPIATPPRSWRSLLGGGLMGLGALAVLLLVWRPRRAARVPAPGQFRDDDDALLAIARACSLRIGTRTTLSEIAHGLTARTGIRLDQHLADHLRARYGSGPPPAPWPVEALRAAARQRSGTPRA